MESFDDDASQTRSQNESEKTRPRIEPLTVAKKRFSLLPRTLKPWDKVRQKEAEVWEVWLSSSIGMVVRCPV